MFDTREKEKKPPCKGGKKGQRECARLLLILFFISLFVEQHQEKAFNREGRVFRFITTIAFFFGDIG